MDAQHSGGYASLAEDEQVAALLPVAEEAAAQFGLEIVGLDLVAHAYNTTFAVTTTGGDRWALRVNTASGSTPAEVDTQQAWQLAIASETPVRVPVPRPTTAGAWWAQVPSATLGRDLLVTCASWLDAGQQAVLRQARELTSDAFARLYTGTEVIPLHADLHGANLTWHEGRLAIFDFDDCGLGVPALDLATTTFYLRGPDPAPEEALRAGYAEVAPLPEVTEATFEAVVASRQLLLAAVVLNSTTAGLRADAQAYTVTAVDRLHHWLTTGRFSLAVG